MTRFVLPNERDWGVIRFSAVDQAKLFSRIDQLMLERHRRWGMLQLRQIVPEQRWGLARANSGAAHAGWTLAFKGGWLGRPCGPIEHQAGLFTRPGEHFSPAVLTDCNPSVSYGRTTQEQISRIMLDLD